MLLVWIALAWMLGIIVADQIDIAPTPLGGLALGGLLFVLGGWRVAWLRTLGLCLLATTLGAVRYQTAQIPTSPQSVWLLVDQGELTIQGFINSDPRRNEEGQQLVLHTQSARIGTETRRVTGHLLVKLPPYPHYRYGQQLQLRGELSLPATARRAGEFDYRDYLARQGIFVLMQDPLVRVLPGTQGNPFYRGLLAFRDHCQAVLLRSLPEPQASLAIGILLGLQSSVPDEVSNAFSTTGLSHILVVSGWNFTIVAAILGSIATRLRLGRGISFWCSLAVMWIYALFVGAAPGVIRAAVMASTVLLAQTLERSSQPWHLLGFACLILSAWDPQALWDLGFQLSVLATAGLFAFATPIQEWLQRCPPLRWPGLSWATEALTATLAAQVLALPIILYHFGNLSVIAPLANVLIVPVVPYAMLLGSITLLSGLCWLPLGQWIALGVWVPLAWISEGAVLLAQVPGAAVQIPPFPLWLLLSYYTVIVGWYVWREWASLEQTDLRND